MPRFTGQNKKRVNPRYFLNETMDPRIAAMMTLKPGAQVRLTTGEVAEIVDVLEPGQVYEVVIDGGSEERTITIQDIDMSKLKAPGDLGEAKKQPLKEAMIYVSPKAAKEIAGMLGQAAAGHKALVEMISYMDRYLGATATDFIGPASKDIMQIGELMSKIIKEYQTKVKAHKRIEDPQQSAESGVDALQKLAR